MSRDTSHLVARRRGKFPSKGRDPAAKLSRALRGAIARRMKLLEAGIPKMIAAYEAAKDSKLEPAQRTLLERIRRQYEILESALLRDEELQEGEQ